MSLSPLRRTGLWRTGLWPVALLAALASPAAAQVLGQAPPGGQYVRPGNEIGTGQSLPASDQPSNLAPSTAPVPYGYRLPAPAIDENAPVSAFLDAARHALAAGRTGEAQEALERAESRALVRSVRPSRAGQASRQPVVERISAALAALATGDRQAVLQHIDEALAAEAAEAP